MASRRPDPKDCFLVEDLLDPEFAEHAFSALRAEVDWQVMNHRGNEVPRLVAVQGQFEEDGRYDRRL